MFRNTRQNFRRTYLAAGLGAFLAYCVWMLSESINSDEPVDLEYMMLLTLGGVGMFLLPYSQMSILSWLAVKELESRIRIVNPTSIPYSSDEQYEDKRILTTALLQMQQESYLDRCKLNTLRLYSKSFGLVIDANYSKPGNPGQFRAQANKIIFPAMLHKQSLQHIKATLSNNLRFSIEAYNNLRHGYCIFTQNNMRRSYPLIHSTESGRCWQDKKDNQRVNALINLDIDRVDYLYKILNKPAKQLRAGELADLDKFDDLLRKANYKHSMLHEHDKFAVSMFLPHIQRAYAHNEKGNKYFQTELDNMVGVPRPVEYFEKHYNFKGYIASVLPDMNQITYIFSDPTDKSIRALQKDYLRNVIARLGIAHAVEESQFNIHFTAMLDEVHANCLPAIPGEVNLAEWVFKNLYKHLKNRAVPEYVECLQNSRVKMV